MVGRQIGLAPSFSISVSAMVDSIGRWLPEAQANAAMSAVMRAKRIGSPKPYFTAESVDTDHADFQTAATLRQQGIKDVLALGCILKTDTMSVQRMDWPLLLRGGARTH